MISGPLHEHLRRTSEPPQLDEFGVTDQTRRAFSAAMGEWIIGDSHGFWLEPECRDGHCDPIEVVATIAERLHELSSSHNGNEFGSPIEEQLFAALLWVDCNWARFPKFDAMRYFEEEPSRNLGNTCEFWITPQAKIAGYKVDLLLWVECGTRRAGIAVECDGHNFHEKTKDQAARDKKRDRDLLAAGYPVMRFTGSEIYRDATECAKQVLSPLSDALDRVTPGVNA